MNKKMFGKRNIIALILVLLSAHSLAAEPSGTFECDLNVVAVSAGSSAAFPAENCLDNDPVTFWQLESGSQYGWIEFGLSAEKNIYGVSIDAELAADATAYVEYLQNGKWKKFINGKIESGSYQDLFLDFSLDNSAASIVRLQIIKSSGDDESRIYGFKVFASDQSLISRKISDFAYSDDPADSIFYASEALFDSNARTEWKTNEITISPETRETLRFYYMSLKNNEEINFVNVFLELDDLLDEVNEAPSVTEPATLEHSTGLIFERPVMLDEIRVFLTDSFTGDLTFRTDNGNGYQTLASISGSITPGWQIIPLVYNQELSNLEILQSGYAVILGGISEVEFWESSAPAGESGAEAINSQNSGSGEAYRVFSVEDRNGYTLRFCIENSVRAEIPLVWNGVDKTAAKTGEINGISVFTLDIDKEELCDLTEIAEFQLDANEVLTDAQLIADQDDGCIDFDGGIYSDGILFQENTAQDELVFDLQAESFINNVFLYGDLGGTAKVQVYSDEAWIDLQPVPGNELGSSFNGNISSSQIRVIPNGAEIAEIRISGSPLPSLKPEICILWPAEGTSVIQALGFAGVVFGTVDDPAAEITVNGIPAERSENWFWLNVSSLGFATAGSYDITVTASAYGETVEKTITVNYSLAGFYKIDDAGIVIITSNSSYLITGTATPEYNVYINNTIADRDGNNISFEVNLEPGLNLIPVKVFSVLNSTVMKIYKQKIIYLSESLSLNIESPEDGEFIYNGEAVIEGSVFGQGTPDVTVNGVSADIIGNNFISQPVALSDGANTITVVASDGSGGVITKELTLFADSTPPVISNVSPNESTGFITDQIVTISGTIEDESDFSVWVDGNVAQVSGNDFSVSLPYPDGSISFLIETRDYTGNISSYTGSFIKDTTPPENLSLVINPSTWTNQDPAAVFSATDAVSGIDHYEILVEGSAAVTAESPYIFTGLDEGDIIITLIAYDNAGWPAMTEATAYIDRTAPKNPMDFRVVPGDSQAEIRWRELSTDIDYYTIERSPAWDSGAVILSYDEFIADGGFNDTGLTNGEEYTYYLTSTDFAGNECEYTLQNTILSGIEIQPLIESSEGMVIEYEKVSLLMKKETIPENVDSIAITEIDQEAYSDISDNGIVGPVYRFCAQLAGEDDTFTQEHVNFSEPYLCELEYDENDIPEGVNETNLDVYYLDPVWGRWFVVPDCAISPENNKIYFSANHFTDFSLQPTVIDELSPDELRAGGISPFDSYVKQGPVTVSSQSGTVSLQATDLVLPGIDGFNLVISRIYDSDTARLDGQQCLVNAAVNNSITSDSITESSINSLFSEAKSNPDGTGDFAEKRSNYESRLKSQGDYALSAGIGWKLNFPSINYSNKNLLITLPNGGTYSLSGLELAKTRDMYVFNLDDGQTIDVELYNHRNGDFKFYTTFQKHERSTGHMIVGHEELGYYSTISYRLVTKDGTDYDFDSDGRILTIKSPDQADYPSKIIAFDYDEDTKLITTITDSFLRVLHFSYETGGDGSGGNNFLRPRISSIEVRYNGESEKTVYYDYGNDNLVSDTGEDTSVTLPLLTKVTDPGNRLWTYSYRENKKTICSDVYLVNINDAAGTILGDDAGIFIIENENLLENPLEKPVRAELIYSLENIQGPGVGFTHIDYQDIYLTSTTTNYNSLPSDFKETIKDNYNAVTRLVVAGIYTDTEPKADPSDYGLATTYSYQFEEYNYHLLNRQTEKVVTDRISETEKTEITYFDTGIKRMRYLGFEPEIETISGVRNRQVYREIDPDTNHATDIPTFNNTGVIFIRPDTREPWIISQEYSYQRYTGRIFFKPIYAGGNDNRINWIINTFEDLAADKLKLYCDLDKSILDVYNLMSRVEIYNGSGQSKTLYQTVDYSFDIDTNRMIARNTTKAGFGGQQTEKIVYDDWGNVIYSEVENTFNETTSWTKTWAIFLNGMYSYAPNMNYFSSMNSYFTDSAESCPSLLTSYNFVTFQNKDKHDLPAFTWSTASNTDTAKSVYMEYNSSGKMVSSYEKINGSYAKTDFSYHSVYGWPTTIVQPGGHTINMSYYYSENDEYLKTISGQTAESSIGNDDIAINTFSAVDIGSGWKVLEVDARGYASKYEYDVLGRIKGIYQPSDTAEEAGWNITSDTQVNSELANLDTDYAEGKCLYTHYDYNNTDYITTATLPDGSVINYDYDSKGRLVEINSHVSEFSYNEEKDNFEAGAEDTLTTVINYDGRGNIVSVVKPGTAVESDGTAISQVRDEFKYDFIGRNISSTRNAEASDSLSKTIEYNDRLNRMAITDERGNSIVQHFNFSGKVISTIQSCDEYLFNTVTAYDGFGNIISSRDANGNTVTSEYNERNQPVNINMPEAEYLLSGQNSEITARLVQNTLYDEKGNKTEEKLLNGGTVAGPVTQYIYDSAGRLERKEITDGAELLTYEEYEYDPAGNVLAVTNILGREMSYDYFPRGLVSSETSPGLTSSDYNVVTYEYNSRGNRTSMTGPRGNITGAYADKDFVIEYYYDELNRLIGAKLPASESSIDKPVIRFAYTERNKLAYRINPDDSAVSYVYNGKDLPVSETIWELGINSGKNYTTSYTYDAAGNAETVTLPGNKTTRNYYNERNQVIKTVQPENTFENSGITVYDGNGNVIESYDANGYLTRFEYDSLNRLSKQTDARKNESLFYYDYFGNKTKYTDRNGNSYLYEYNILQQMIKDTDPFGNFSSYNYDVLGNIVDSTDKNGITAVYGYTWNYLPEEVSFYSGYETEDETLELTQSYVYDESGFIVTAKEISNQGTVFTMYNIDESVISADSAAGMTLDQLRPAYTPDPYGRIFNKTQLLPDGHSSSLSYSYDIMDRLTEILYPDGESVQYGFNSLNELESVSDYITAGNVTYGNDGLIDQISYANGITRAYDFDDNNRLINLEYSGSTDELPSFDFGYDYNGNITSKNDSEYIYDALNQLTWAKLSGAFEIDVMDKDQLIGTQNRDYSLQKSVNFPVSETRIALDFNSVSLAVDLGNSFQVSKIEIHPQAAAYRDLAGRIDVLTSETNEKSGWTLVNRDDWVLEQISDDWFTIYFRVPVEGRYIKVHNYYDDRDYTNEALWELSTIKREAENSRDTSDFFKVYYMESEKYETYSYDKNGNRISLTEELGDAVSETEYTYIQVQTGINTDRLIDAGPLHFEYDNNGNMISKYNSETDESFEYHYDALNRLVQVKKGGTLTVSYLYSHQGYRVKTVSIEHGTTYYSFDETGLLLLEETTELNTNYIYLSGQHLAKNEYTPGDKASQETYFYLTDHLGSTICLTDSTGKILWQDDYTPFGETSGDTGTKHETGMYTGKQLDPDTGLYYSNARWYDAELGRFITEDPIKDGLNWYVYVSNNPLTRIDPSGLVWYDENGVAHSSVSEPNGYGYTPPDYSSLDKGKSDYYLAMERWGNSVNDYGKKTNSELAAEGVRWANWRNILNENIKARINEMGLDELDYPDEVRYAIIDEIIYQEAEKLQSEFQVLHGSTGVLPILPWNGSIHYELDPLFTEYQRPKDMTALDAFLAGLGNGVKCGLITNAVSEVYSLEKTPTVGELTNKVAEATRGTVTELTNGYNVLVPYKSKGISIRIMAEGGGRTNYFRISIPGKETFTIEGLVSTDQALTHMSITEYSFGDIMRIIIQIMSGG